MEDAVQRRYIGRILSSRAANIFFLEHHLAYILSFTPYSADARLEHEPKLGLYSDTNIQVSDV